MIFWRARVGVSPARRVKADLVRANLGALADGARLASIPRTLVEHVTELCNTQVLGVSRVAPVAQDRGFWERLDAMVTCLPAGTGVR